jgi:imidazolonepropionase
MKPEEALNAITLNAAYALELQDIAGSIGIGKKANLIITEPVSSLAFIPYNFGNPVIGKMIINGKIFKENILI